VENPFPGRQKINGNKDLATKHENPTALCGDHKSFRVPSQKFPAYALRLLRQVLGLLQVIDRTKMVQEGLSTKVSGFQHKSFRVSAQKFPGFSTKVSGFRPPRAS
jgi:hypothetical protein